MIAIISDIHGNYPALKEVIAEIDSTGCKQIFSLGDVAGYYCMINECIEMLRERGITNLLGNHDFYLTHNKPCPRSRSATVCLEYQKKNITEKNLTWLKESQTSLLYDEISMVHGGWTDPVDEYLFEIDEDYFNKLHGKIFLSGHTHVQSIFRFSEKIYCNPGSVGQPRDGDPRAAFAVISDGKVFLKRVEYNIDAISFQMKKKGFAPYFYENLYHGSRIGGQLSSVSVKMARSGRADTGKQR